MSVLFSVPRIGNTEIVTLIKNEEAYIPVKEIFDYLKIKNTVSGDLDSLSGFFIDPKATYLIDKIHNRIAYGGKVLELDPLYLVQTETSLYLKSTIFCQVFGLDCRFSFRDLSFTLTTNIELPAVREMQQQQIRKNLGQLKGEIKADTVLKRSFSFLHFGMADWLVTTTQETHRPSYLRASVSLGGTLLGGEATVNLNYYKDQPFSPRQQYYRWRYVNNELSLIRQISVGRISTPSVSSLFAPVDGIQITNTPTIYRKSFGTYRYTGTTEPEWMVELYVNNVLVNYVRADASGFYTFEIPIVYGSSAIRLKFYGAWGEESTKEEAITIPFNFLPAHQLEYTTSAGVVEDGNKSRFSRTVFNYGLDSRITLGGGAEYLSSVMQGRPMPFVNASLRIFSRLIVNGEWVQGVRAKGTLNYRLPTNVQLDLSYTKFNKGQTAIRYNYLEERKASLSFPIRLKKFTAFSRMSYNRYVLPKFRYGNVEFLVSAAAPGISSNLRTYVQFKNQGRPEAYTNLSLSFQLPYGIRFAPQLQYQYDRKGFSTIKADAEKRISQKGYLNLSYENNRYLYSSSVTLGLRYDFSFARSFFSARRGNKTTATTQSASGSLVYERKAANARLDNQASVGKGGFVIVSFLDLNCNGRRDAGDPRVSGLHLRVNGGHVEQREDSSLLVTGLEAYTPYFIELDKSSFDNIAWQLKKATIKAIVEPNQLKLIEVPVAVVGEASGMVYLKNSRQQKGLSRILVNFYDTSHQLVAYTLTEGDGYFSFLGLAPGRYTAQVDTGQLGFLNLSATPQSLSFTIAANQEGTIADGFEFVLHSLVAEDEKQTVEQQGSLVARKQEGERRDKLQPVKNQSITIKQKTKEKKSGVSKLPVPKNQSQDSISTSTVVSSEPVKDSFKPSQAAIIKTPKPVKSKQPSVWHLKKQRVNKQQLPTAKSQSLSQTRKQLLLEQQKLDKRHKEATQRLRQLMKERERLMEEQKKLHKEIQELKRRLLLKKRNGNHKS